MTAPLEVQLNGFVQAGPGYGYQNDSQAAGQKPGQAAPVPANYQIRRQQRGRELQGGRQSQQDSSNKRPPLSLTNRPAQAQRSHEGTDLAGADVDPEVARHRQGSDPEHPPIVPFL